MVKSTGDPAPPPPIRVSASTAIQGVAPLTLTDETSRAPSPLSLNMVAFSQGAAGQTRRLQTLGLETKDALNSPDWGTP